MKDKQAKDLCEFVRKAYGEKDFVTIEKRFHSSPNINHEKFTYRFYSNGIGGVDAVSFYTLVRLVIATYEAKGFKSNIKAKDI